MGSVSVENYLKAIFEIEEEHGRATTTALAERLAVASPSVTEMIKRLAGETPPLVKYRRHHGVTLSDEGRRQALRVLRRHRLLETFLMRVLDYSWDEVHEEAEQLEHHISERFEARVAALLDHPAHDPHGSPIPAADGAMATVASMSLRDLAVGRSARVVRIRDDSPDLLRYLATLGIEPEETIEVEERSPFEGPLHVLVGTGRGRRRRVIGLNAADRVLVTREDAT